MRKLITYNWLFVLFTLAACSYDFPEEEQPTRQDWGEMNPENLVVIGDGFLAGLMDGALYNDGQKNSIAAIVNKQISTVEEVPFMQAEIDSEIGLNLFVKARQKEGKWIYQFKNKTDEEPYRVLLPGEDIKAFDGDRNTLNDVTVPLLKVGELDNAPFETNEFIDRVYSENNPNLIEQIIQKSPSFVLCWLGMNDFLDFAVSGATQSEKLTSIELFTSNFETLVEGLVENTETKIVLGNLPSIEDLPYFYVRPYNSLFLENDKLNEAFARYSQFNKAVAEHNRNATPDSQRPFIDFYDNGSSLAPQRFVVIDNSLPEAFYLDGAPLEKYRQLNQDELLLFSLTREAIENGEGVLIPIEETGYLLQQQRELIENKLLNFNQVISDLAAKFSNRIELLDLNMEIKKIADTGKTDAWGEPISDELFYFDGVPIEGTVGVNGIFSLDGLHFNQRGNAFVANLFLQQINNELKANIPMININAFVGNTYSD